MFRRHYSLTILIIIFSCMTIFGQTPKATKTKVLVLASFHFDNPGLDVANTKVDDVLASKRQKEIKEVVKLLKKFKPTKVAVEAEFGSEKVSTEFTDYLKGKYKLSRNEIDQIGYRLAKELGHKKVYPIDWNGKFDFGKVVSYAKENGQGELAKSFEQIAQKITKELEEDLKTKTFREIFREMNSKKTLDNYHRLYFLLSKIGKGKNYVGADLLSDWFERNLKIYTNISRISNKKDRILVLVGASHAPILQRFLRDSNFEVVDAMEFL